MPTSKVKKPTAEDMLKLNKRGKPLFNCKGSRINYDKDGKRITNKMTNNAAREILNRLAAGETLDKICSDSHLPSYLTVYRALREGSEWAQTFRKLYAKARDDQADTFFEKIVEQADSTTSENANAMRVRMDAYKWVVSKMKPQKYGDRQIVETPTDSEKVVIVMPDNTRVVKYEPKLGQYNTSKQPKPQTDELDDLDKYMNPATGAAGEGDSGGDK